LFSLWRGDYRPAGDALVEGAQLRAVLAPFDGFLDDALVRPGDSVAAGERLATLDARELELQRLKWLSEKAQAQRQYEDALATNDRADVQIYRAQIDRSQAELELLEYQLERTELRTPFDAVVVEGDLSQRIGSAVRLGETLFELAPAGKYRIVVFIDEFTIGDIQLGQTGEVVLSALASRALPITVTRIMPMAQVRDGETVYRVEGELQADDVAVRPGLVGVAKIDVDERLVIVNWTRTLLRWLRLQIWRLWG
jgi:multidrug resistance efflux pump